MIVETIKEFEEMLRKTECRAKYNWYKIFEQLKGEDSRIILYKVLMKDKNFGDNIINQYISSVKNYPKNLVSTKECIEVLIETIEAYPDVLIKTADISMYYYRKKMKEDNFNDKEIEKYEEYANRYLNENLNVVKEYVKILICYLKNNGTNGVIETPSQYYSKLINLKLKNTTTSKDDIRDEVIICGLAEYGEKVNINITKGLVGHIRNLDYGNDIEIIGMIMRNGAEFIKYLNLGMEYNELKRMDKILENSITVPSLHIELKSLIRGRKRISQHMYEVL